MSTSKVIRLNGVPLHYIEQVGPGPAVVVLHGLSGSHAEFLHLLPEVAGQAHLYLLDLRGHGCSGWTAAGYQLADYGRDTAAFLQQVVGRPAIVVGHSLGGYVAVWLAARAPHLLQGVLLSDSNFYLVEMPRFAHSSFYAYFADLRDYLDDYHANGAVLEEMVTHIGRTPVAEGKTWLEVAGAQVVAERAMQLHQMDPAVLRPFLAGALWEPGEPDALLGRVRCPVHLLTAADSGVFDEQDRQRFLAPIPQATYTVIAHAGHDIHLDQPEAFVKELRDFIGYHG